MKLVPQSWQSFKFTVGLVIIFSTISYGIFVTIMVLFFGRECAKDQNLWLFITNVISTTLGWFMAKSSTVIDYIYGAAVKSPPAGGKPNETEIKPGVNSLSSDESGVRRPTNGEAGPKDLGLENPNDRQTGVRHDLQDSGFARQPGQTPGDGKVEGNPVG